MDDCPWNVLSSLDPIGFFVHEVVWVFESAYDVVCPQIRVEAVLGPDASNRARGLDDYYIRFWMELEIYFGDGEAMPAWLVLACTHHS